MHGVLVNVSLGQLVGGVLGDAGPVLVNALDSLGLSLAGLPAMAAIDSRGLCVLGDQADVALG